MPSGIGVPKTQKLHVLLRKEELDAARLADKVVVVLDVLFATLSIVTALAHGALEVIPALDEADARAEAGRYPQGSYVLAGEKNIVTIAGFARPTPLALREENLAGRRLIYATTNGTVALRLAEGAVRVYAAALLNAAAVVERIRDRHPHNTVLLVCAGSGGAFNLEDFYGAGCLVERFAAGREAHYELSDAALAARSLYRCRPAVDCLLESRLGRIMARAGLAEEVRFAARRDEFSVAPVLTDGRLCA